MLVWVVVSEFKVKSGFVRMVYDGEITSRISHRNKKASTVNEHSRRDYTLGPPWPSHCVRLRRYKLLRAICEPETL